MKNALTVPSPLCFGLLTRLSIPASQQASTLHSFLPTLYPPLSTPDFWVTPSDFRLPISPVTAFQHTPPSPRYPPGSIILAYRYRSKYSNHPLLGKVVDILRGFRDGLKTIAKVKRPGWFIVHSIFIWLMYYLMTWLDRFSHPHPLGHQGRVLPGISFRPPVHPARSLAGSGRTAW